jgi:hypothetical protein
MKGNDMNEFKPGSFGALPLDLRESDTNGDIHATSCLLTSLSGCPDKVNGNFSITGNSKLTSLVGGPCEIGETYSAENCNILSLAGAPTVVGHSFTVMGNQSLNSLVGGPIKVGGFYSAANCGLVSLDGLPVTIGTSLFLRDNPLTSLQGINKLKEMNGWIGLANCPITSHILGVFFIKGCKGVRINDTGNFGKAANIVNVYLYQGRAGVLACTQELIEAGLDDFANI